MPSAATGPKRKTGGAAAAAPITRANEDLTTARHTVGVPAGPPPPPTGAAPPRAPHMKEGTRDVHP